MIARLPLLGGAAGAILLALHLVLGVVTPEAAELRLATLIVGVLVLVASGLVARRGLHRVLKRNRREVRRLRRQLGTKTTQVSALRTEVRAQRREHLRQEEMASLERSKARLHELHEHRAWRHLRGADPWLGGRRRAVELALELGRHGQLVYARRLFDEFDIAANLPTPQLRAAYAQLNGVGYHGTALAVARALHARTSDPRDLARIRQSAYHESSLSWQPDRSIEPDPVSSLNHRGPVVHFVGKALPHTQTGYTLRTQYLTAAQLAAGMHPVVVAAAGGEQRTLDEPELDVIAGVEVHRLAGPARASVPWDEWMTCNVEGLQETVRRTGPSVIHAHSDFVQGLIAGEVGRRTGVPVVYETRGFWEETWLSRTQDRFGSLDLHRLFELAGMPDAYVLRQAQEAAARAAAQRVATLSAVMADHIVHLDGGSGRVPALVCNAVDPASFVPSGGRGRSRRESLGIPEDAHVFGCITSVVEYEGLDLLVDAFAALAADRVDGPPIALLVVGGGPSLAALRDQVASRSLTGAHLVGAVPHDEVPSFYDAIDTVVLPRRPTSVTRLVTPLKPFEALAMGKRLIVSDVEALAEIARESQCGRTFAAGDAADLAAVMAAETEPTADDDGEQARQWVLQHRTWDVAAAQTAAVYEELALQRFTPS